MVYERRGGGRRFGGGGGRGQGGGGFRSSRPSFGGGGRPQFDRPSFDRESPVKVGEEYDVEITEVGSRGDGITRIKNFVVFVPETKRGDKVKIRIKEVRGKSAVGEVVRGEGEVEGVTEEGLAENVSKEEYGGEGSEDSEGETEEEQ